MPKRHKGEDNEHIHDRAFTSAEGNINVSNYPAVERAVPGSPEGEGGVIVGHAAEHVLGSLDTICHRPKTEETPWNEQLYGVSVVRRKWGGEDLEPDDLEVKITYHAELEGRGPLPRTSFRNCDDIRIMENNFHRQQGKQKPQSKKHRPLRRNRRRRVPQLPSVTGRLTPHT
jgi:hypothetical protein